MFMCVCLHRLPVPALCTDRLALPGECDHFVAARSFVCVHVCVWGVCVLFTI